MVTAQILAALYEAPIDPESKYHSYSHPEIWEEILKEIKAPSIEKSTSWQTSLQPKFIKVGLDN